MSGIWELPFGKGRRLASSLNPVADRIIGGWQISGVYTFQSGAPIGFGNIFFNGDVNNIRIPGDQQSVNGWFNTEGGFVKEAAAQPVSNIRTFPLRFGFIRSDQINNYDLSLLKNTRITEGKNLQFKAEFLNAFNHPLFAAPNTTVTAAGFGKIQSSTQANYSRRIQLNVKFIF